MLRTSQRTVALSILVSTANPGWHGVASQACGTPLLVKAQANSSRRPPWGNSQLAGRCAWWGVWPAPAL